MVKQQAENGMKKSQAANIKCEEGAQRNSKFSSCWVAETIAQLKRLALDPCQPQFAPDYNRPFLDLILRIKKYMHLNESRINLRKRKHERLINGRPEASSVFAVLNQQIISAEGSQLPSADSCLVSSIVSGKSSDKLCPESGNSSSLTIDETLLNKKPKLSGKYMSAKVDYDESERGSTPSSLRKLRSDEFRSSSKPPSPGKLKSKITKTPQSKSALGPSKATRATKPLQPLESSWLQTLMDDYDGTKNVIPIGPRFQADVPELNGPVDKDTLVRSYGNDPNVIKWLGTRTWPLKSRSPKPSERGVGQGRPNTCSCVSHGSVDCVVRHICDDRKLLRSDLGSAFFSWKLHETGDQILKPWTAKERTILESLLKSRSQNGDFVKLSLMKLRNKCRADIVSYYFNVYIPERMSIQTRSPTPVQIDTDEDEDGGKYLGCKKRPVGSKNVARSKSNGKSLTRISPRRQDVRPFLLPTNEVCETEANQMISRAVAHSAIEGNNAIFLEY